MRLRFSPPAIAWLLATSLTLVLAASSAASAADRDPSAHAVRASTVRQAKRAKKEHHNKPSPQHKCVVHNLRTGSHFSCGDIGTDVSQQHIIRSATDVPGP
jgi:hypothetical protein